ncbi:hypothetical protein IQ254_25665, partial [Nodosilinea sp. LEGE 07088]|uniref:hypothetical protein n=1 Tax=Nodosilinea sp. LEGE 07088 TaxID=2777968 RepID=UPI00187E81E2
MPQLPSGLSTRPETFAPSGESSLRLQRAIESLNLNLDDELRRYRQSRLGQSTAPATPARLQLRQQRKPLDLIAVQAATAGPGNAAAGPGKTAASSESSAAVAGSTPSPSPRLQEVLGQASVPSSQAYPPTTAVNQVRLSHGGTLTTYRAAPEEYYESTEALLSSSPNGAQATRSRRRQESEYDPSPLRQLLTPLGMGALLLLLVGSAGFGYLVTSPETAQYITDNPIARRLKGEPTDTEAAIALGEANGVAETGFQPMGPDLSEKEFMSLDLNSISTLPSEEPSSAVQATPVQLQPEVGGRPGQPGSPAATDATRSALLRTEIVSAPGRSTAGASTSARPTTPTPRSTPPSTAAIAPA